MNVPDAVGVPLIVIVLAFQEAVTPAGKLLGTPMPVAPVVVWVIAVSAVLIQSVGEDDAALTVLAGVTVTSRSIVLLVSLQVVTPTPLLFGVVIGKVTVTLYEPL